MKGWERSGIVARVAQDLEDGWYVNLGIGLPVGVPDHLPAGRSVSLHSENGLLGVGPIPAPGQEDPDLTSAGKSLVTLNPGGSAFDSVTSFALVRGGRLDLAVMGGLEVSAAGDLANWYVPGGPIGVGGAMDLAFGAQRVWIAMEHHDRSGRPKLVDQLALPATALGAVDRVYTNLGVFSVGPDGLCLLEAAPGLSFEEIAAECLTPLNAPVSHGPA